MDDYPKRLLFVCASHSIRSLLAASLLSARARGPWEIWHTPAPVSQQEHELARQVLDEMGMALLSPSQETEPCFGLTWDEGILLCSGLADT